MLLTAVAIFAGCTAAPTQLTPEHASAINRVGVISLVARDFHRSYVGLTAFGNEQEKVDISVWRVDSDYEEQLSDALRALRKVPIVGTIDKAPYVSARLDRAAGLIGVEPDWAALTETVQRQASEHRLDAVLVLTTRVEPNFARAQALTLRGAGFYARGVGDTTRFSTMHLFATVGLLDGRSGQLLASVPIQATDYVEPEIARRRLPTPDSVEGRAIRDQLIRVPGSHWGFELRKLFAGR